MAICFKAVEQIEAFKRDLEYTIPINCANPLELQLNIKDIYWKVSPEFSDNIKPEKNLSRRVLSFSKSFPLLAMSGWMRNRDSCIFITQHHHFSCSEMQRGSTRLTVLPPDS